MYTVFIIKTTGRGSFTIETIKRSYVASMSCIKWLAIPIFSSSARGSDIPENTLLMKKHGIDTIFEEPDWL